MNKNIYNMCSYGGNEELTKGKKLSSVCNQYVALISHHVVAGKKRKIPAVTASKAKAPRG